MRKLIINRYEAENLVGALETREEWLKSKLKKAGFDLEKPIMSWINYEYVYAQNDLPSLPNEAASPMTKEEMALIIVKLLAKSMFYGDWKWDTPNERVIELLMRQMGFYPFDSEDVMIGATMVPDDLYQKAREAIK
jgi:hypothetical protein